LTAEGFSAPQPAGKALFVTSIINKALGLKKTSLAARCSMLPRTGSKGGGKKAEFVLGHIPIIQSEGTNIKNSLLTVDF